MKSTKLLSDTMPREVHKFPYYALHHNLTEHSAIDHCCSACCVWCVLDLIQQHATMFRLKQDQSYKEKKERCGNWRTRSRIMSLLWRNSSRALRWMQRQSKNWRNNWKEVSLFSRCGDKHIAVTHWWWHHRERLCSHVTLFMMKQNFGIQTFCFIVFLFIFW